MNKSFSFSLKALPIALASALSLTACDNAPKTVQSEQVQTPSIVRVASESLYADYAEMRAKQVSNVTYGLTLHLDSESTEFSGVTTLNFDLAENNSNDLTIDFDSGKVNKVTVNGKSVDVGYEKWFITIKASFLRPGTNSISIDYQRPYSTDGSGLHRFVDPESGEVYLYTDFQPYNANKLFPHFDQPDLKATYTLTVDAPKQWKIISSTREEKIEDKGELATWYFPESAKFSSYVFAMHAGNFTVWEDSYQDIPLRLFARQSMAKYVKTEEWFPPTKQAFAFFNDYFGIKYPFIKYDQVIVPDYNAGAMENVAAVTFNENYISRGEKPTRSKMRLANTIAHELAHMWFGDLVTMRWWNGLWLNESFATYMANLAIDKASDYDNAWDVFYSGTKQWAYRSDDSVNTHAIELPVPSTADALTNFDGITYGKGASVLKQLPYYLGEENFRQGVSNYLKKFSYKNTDLDDFIGELGKAAGKDLSQWTQDWLYQAGLNTIKVNYQCDQGLISAFAIEQSSPEGYPTLREQRVQIGSYNLVGDVMKLTKATPVIYSGETTHVNEMIGQQCPDLVYPNEGDWGYVKVDLDQKSLDSVRAHINSVESATMRLMLWQSLADSVNDAKLPADQFVNFALANIEGEQNYNVVRKIAMSLSSAAGYLETATRNNVNDYSSLYQEVEDLYLRLLEKSSAGSDEQKLWYSRYVSIAKSTEHLEKLANILNGEQAFDGLSIDQDKRWGIIVKLNRYQHGNYQALLEAEKLTDNSDSGVKSAIYAEVVRPEPEVKAKWFNVVMDNPEQLKLSTLRYIMWGLFPNEQKVLEAPYKDKIISRIPALNEGSDLGLLGTYTSLMVPAQCTKASETELAALVKQFGHMKPQVVKSLKETHEDVARCVKALALLK